MIKKFLHIIILTILFSSCQKENMGDCFKSTGKEITVERVSEDFSRIKMVNGIHVFISQGNSTSIHVKGGKNLLNNVKTEVLDGVLTIENTNKCNWVRSFKKEISVYLTVTNLTEIDYTGSGDIHFETPLNTDKFFLNMFQASGTVNLDLNCSLIELKIHTGPGKINASGNTTELVLFNNGPGYIDAKNLISQGALAINQNTGKVYVNAVNSLKAEINGSGNIFYSGNPTIDFTKNGSGNLYPD